jgi:hypothetical protein
MFGVFRNVLLMGGKFGRICRIGRITWGRGWNWLAVGGGDAAEGGDGEE